MTKVVEIDLHGPSPAKQHDRATHRTNDSDNEWEDNGPDPLDMRQWVERQSVLEAGGIIATAYGHPSVGELVQHDQTHKSDEENEAVNQGVHV